MAINLSGAVTGAAQTGLTSPTYTVASAQAPTSLGKQYIVASLGGTQTGVEPHAGSNPFLINFVVPANYRSVQMVNSAGVGLSRGMNVTSVKVLKGVSVDGAANKRNALFDLQCRIPPGADVYDPESIRAAISFLIGVLSNQSAGFGDTVIAGAS